MTLVPGFKVDKELLLLMEKLPKLMPHTERGRHSHQVLEASAPGYALLRMSHESTSLTVKYAPALVSTMRALLFCNVTGVPLLQPAHLWPTIIIA